MARVEQSFFWKLIFFTSSVTFFGLFFSLPMSIIIVALIHLQCHSSEMARQRLSLNSSGVMYLPIMGAMSLTDGYVIDRKRDMLVYLTGPIVTLFAVILFSFNFIVTSDPYIGEITKVLIIACLINLLPVSMACGGGIIRSICFSSGKMIGIMSVFVPILMFHYLSFHWSYYFFIPFLIASYDFRVLVFQQPAKRPMSKLEQFGGIIAYSAVVSLLVALLSYFSEFSDAGALTSFILGK